MGSLIKSIINFLGTGKSFLICGLRQLIGVYTRCVVSAFTGKAANNISGTTLHSCLFLPIKGPLRYLKDMQLQSLQASFPQGSFLIIDEYSMVGLRLLGRIDSRLRQATGRHQDMFGGLSVIIIGDILQLPPVQDLPVYRLSNAKKKPDSDEVQHGRSLFAAFKVVVELTQNQRQNDPCQERFRQFLDALRKGKHDSDAAYDLLRPQMVGIASADVVRQFDDAITLNYSKYNVERCNNEAVLRLKLKNNEFRCRIDAV